MGGSFAGSLDASLDRSGFVEVSSKKTEGMVHCYVPHKLSCSLGDPLYLCYQ